MAKQYYQGDFGFKTILKRYPTFKSFVSVLKKDKSNLYLETNDGIMSNIPLVKTIADPKEFNRVLAILTKVKGAKFNIKTRDNIVDVTMGGLTWRYYRSGGRLQNVFDEKGNAKTASKPTIPQQEDGVRYLLESAKLQSKMNINKAVGFNFGQDWHDSFERSFNGISKEIMNPTTMKSYNFYRDSNPKKPKFLNQLTDESILPDKKDNWNPADIWLIQNETKWKKVIEDAVSPNGYRGRRSQTIEELNAIFRTLFKSRQIFGVSLKKISGDEARYEEVNVRSSFFKDIEAMTFKVDKIQCKCGRKNEGFETQDSRMIVKDGVKEYNFQIKANDSTKMSGLKYEPTAKGAGAARLGKATVELVVRLLNDNGFTFSKESSAYPQNADEFLAEETKYKKMFGDLFRRGVDFGSGENADAVFDIFLSIFGTQPHVANSKLQQLTFFHLITSLKPDELDEFGTDMVFLAMKAGRRYGPFAKLY